MFSTKLSFEITFVIQCQKVQGLHLSNKTVSNTVSHSKIVFYSISIFPYFIQVWLHLRKLSVLFDLVFGLMYACMFIGTFPALWWAKGYFKLPSFVVTTLAVEQVH